MKSRNQKTEGKTERWYPITGNIILQTDELIDQLNSQIEEVKQDDYKIVEWFHSLNRHKSKVIDYVKENPNMSERKFDELQISYERLVDFMFELKPLLNDVTYKEYLREVVKLYDGILREFESIQPIKDTPHNRKSNLLEEYYSNKESDFNAVRNKKRGRKELFKDSRDFKTALLFWTGEIYEYLENEGSARGVAIKVLRDENFKNYISQSLTGDNVPKNIFAWRKMIKGKYEVDYDKYNELIEHCKSKGIVPCNRFKDELFNLSGISIENF